MQKRTQHQIQEFNALKDRLERLIANTLNEAYSKLNQIAKESVKAVLSENKKLISVSFTVVIQSLKANPQLANLIYGIPTANNGEQYKDNNNNIIKYLESNKYAILDLAEKNYQNLVEALTNDSISSVAASSLSKQSIRFFRCYYYFVFDFYIRP